MQQSVHNVGRDNGQSVMLDGRSYWGFGDTLETTDSGGVAFLDNSGAMTSDLDASDGVTVTGPDVFTEGGTAAPHRLLPWRAAETAFMAAHGGTCRAGDDYCGTQFAMWPGAMVADPARHRVLVLYVKLCRGGAVKCPSAFVGTGIGTGIAAIYPRQRSVVRLTATHVQPAVPSPEGRDPTLLFGVDDGGSGAAFTDGRYLFALVHCDATFTCVVGRVPLASATDRATWRFYAGDYGSRPFWTQAPGAGKRTTRMGDAGGSVVWVPAMHRWLSTWLQPLGNDAYVQTAVHPWGPWSAPQLMFSTPPTSATANYALFDHAEYATDGGLTRYFTYYSPGTMTFELERVHFCAASATPCLPNG